MKIASWNVNWIRAGIKKGTFFDYLKTQSPDIIGLQEVKAQYEQLSQEDVAEIQSLGYEIYWNPAKRPWYSGTAVLTKVTPIEVKMWIETTDLVLDHLEIDEVIHKNHEWRVIVAEYETFFYITVYTPNAKNDLSRLPYRQIWDEVFLKYMKHLEAHKPVIFCWDLNVAHREIDIANPSANKTTKSRPWNAGFTDQERSGFQAFINAWFVDSFRHFHPEMKEAYTWWSNFWNARVNNVWWRIDYVVVTPTLVPLITKAFIHPEAMGSDHCPVGIEI